MSDTKDSDKMNKKQILDKLAEKTEQKKSVCDAVIDALIELTKEELTAGHDFTVPGLFRARITKRAATKERMGRNPHTNTPLKIAAKPESNKLSISPVTSLKKLIKALPVK